MIVLADDLNPLAAVAAQQTGTPHLSQYTAAKVSAPPWIKTSVPLRSGSWFSLPGVSVGNVIPVRLAETALLDGDRSGPLEFFDMIARLPFGDRIAYPCL